MNVVLERGRGANESGAVMSSDANNHLERAKTFWLTGHPLEAGQLIYDNLPVEVRAVNGGKAFCIHSSGLLVL